jgi:SAM-dependent methyltransferase
MINNTIILKYKKYHNPLSIFTKKYGSDKGSPIDDDTSESGWNMSLYADFYHMLFWNRREKIKTMLEVGIGTNNDSLPSNMTSKGKPGASLRAWRDYFPNATIYGADVDKDILFEEERIKTFYVDQADKFSVAELIGDIDKTFDFIIDDGLHEAHAQITLLEAIYYKLKVGGIYIIEDCINTYREVKNHLDGNGYEYMDLDFTNDSNYCFVIFKSKEPWDENRP